MTETELKTIKLAYEIVEKEYEDYLNGFWLNEDMCDSLFKCLAECKKNMNELIILEEE